MPTTMHAKNSLLWRKRRISPDCTYQKRTSRIGPLLILAILTTSLVGKSVLVRFAPVLWTLQMAATALLIVVAVIYDGVAHIRDRGYSEEFPVHIQALGVMLLVSCVVSCVLQSNWEANLIYFLIYGCTVYLLFCRGSGLLSQPGRLKSTDLIMLLPATMAVIGLLLFSMGVFSSSRQGRLQGVYVSSIVAGQMIGLTAVVFLWRLLFFPPKYSWRWWGIFALLVIALLLTRTRTSLLAFFVGSSCCIVLWRLSHMGTRKTWQRYSLQCTLFCVLAGGVLLALSGIVNPEWVKDFTRTEGDLEGVVASRLEYWERGVEYVSVTNVFGSGPLDKYGGSLSTQESGYVRDQNSHNAILSAFQYYGVLGASGFILLLIALLHTYIKRSDALGVLGITVIGFGIVQCISENWLLSFGTPVDLYSWFLLGLTANRTVWSPKTASIGGCRMRTPVANGLV